MATGANSTAGAAFLRRMYTPKAMVNTVTKKASRLLSMIDHDPTAEGDSYNDLSVVGDNPSGSADFSEAKNRGENSMSTAGQFNVPYVDDFEHPTVSGKLIQQSRGKKGAWLKHLQFEMDSSLRMSAHRRSVAFYTSGFGELGVMSNAPAANGNVVLSDPSTVFRFVKGQKLVFSASLSSNTLRAGQSAIVTQVDYTKYRDFTGPHIVLDTNTNAITGLAQGDTIFTKGDRQDSATPTRVRPAGLETWAPTTAPTLGQPLFGVDRAVNSFFYAWIMPSTATQGLLQSLIEAANLCSAAGNAEKLVAAVGIERFTELSVSLQGQKQYTEIKDSRGVMGFKTLLINADGIELPVIQDRYCPRGRAYVGDPMAFVHPSLGEAPHIAQDDGQEIVRQTDDDGVAVRIRAYENFELRNGAAWAVIPIT